jgi:starch-binding outer membrane protein, SusD/RagB family
MNNKNFYNNFSLSISKGMKVAFFISLIILNFSCKKFLDAKSSSKEEIPSTLDDCQKLLDKSGTLNYGFPFDGENSSDDIYLTDATFGSLNTDEQEIYEWLPTAMHLNYTNSSSWFAPYTAILYANQVLQTYNTLSDNDKNSTTGQNIKGAALMFRSVYFYELAQLYANPYVPATAGKDMGIPLRLTPTVTEKLSRGTVEQTYNQIIHDLDTAANLLPFTSYYISQPTKPAAYAQLARVYLSMGDYTNALINANAALNIDSALVDYNTLNLNNYYPFTSFPQMNAEVLFQGEAPSYINNTAYYGFVTNDLIQLYDTTDLRRNLFFTNNNDGTYTFIGSYDGGAFLYFSGLANDELYLVKAECEARAGNTSNALNTLNSLLVKRYKTGTFVPVTTPGKDDLLVKILTERRKELVYRGTRWTDLRRLNQDPRFAVTLTRTINGVIHTLPPNDLRYTLLIPEDVARLGGYPQNPR